MEKVTYKELSNFYFPTLFDVVMYKVTEQDQVTQTYNFGDIGFHE
jgi:hypothetical protein